MNSIIPESEKGEKLGYIIHWGIVALVFLLPLAYSALVYSTFMIVKATLLQLVTFCLLLLWLVKINIEGSFCFKRSPLDLPVLCFAAAAVLSTLFSVNPLLSLFGAHNRNEGLLTIVTYVFVYFLATNFLDEEKKMSHLLYAILLSSILVSVHGVLQHFGVDWLNLVPGFKIGNFTRAASTLGNPVFLGSFLGLAIPIAISFFLISKEVKGQLLSGAIILLTLLALIFTYARAAWLGFLISILFFLIFVPKKLLGEKKISLAAFILTALVVLIPLMALSYPTATQITTSIGTRAISSLEMGGTVATRLELWKSSLGLIAQRPILGYGLETFQGVFPPFRSQLLVREIEVADRPHNQLLYIAASMGILGLISFLWILIRYFRVGLSYYQEIGDLRNRLILLGILAAALGYFVQEQFSFSLASVTPIFYSLLALPACLTTQKGSETAKLYVSAPNILLLRVLSVLGILVILLITSFSLRSFMADYHFKNGEIIGGAHGGKYGDAIQNFQQAVELSPAVNEYRRALADSYFDKAEQTQDKSWLRDAIATYKEAVEFDPRDINSWVDLGDVYFDQASYPEAFLAYQKALEVDPYYAPAFWGLGDVYIRQRRYSLALLTLKKALDIRPDNKGVWYSLGVAYEGKGRLAEAKRAYQKALKIDPGYEKARERLERLKN